MNRIALLAGSLGLAGLAVLCALMSSWASRQEEQDSPCPYCQIWESCQGTDECCPRRGSNKNRRNDDDSISI